MTHSPLPWTCNRCATRHDTPGLAAQCRRDQQATRRLAIAILVGIALVVGALAIAKAQLAYGDWTCAFSECRKIK